MQGQGAFRKQAKEAALAELKKNVESRQQWTIDNLNRVRKIYDETMAAPEQIPPPESHERPAGFPPQLPAANRPGDTLPCALVSRALKGPSSMMPERVLQWFRQMVGDYFRIPQTRRRRSPYLDRRPRTGTRSGAASSAAANARRLRQEKVARGVFLMLAPCSRPPPSRSSGVRVQTAPTTSRAGSNFLRRRWHRRAIGRYLRPCASPTSCENRLATTLWETMRISSTTLSSPTRPSPST